MTASDSDDYIAQTLGRYDHSAGAFCTYQTVHYSQPRFVIIRGEFDHVSHEPFLKLIKQAAPLQRGALLPKQEPGGEDKGEWVVDMEQTKVTSSLQNYLEFLEERLWSVLGNDKSGMVK